MKYYTMDEETCIGKLLQQIMLDNPSESTRELEEAAFKLGVRLDKCKSVVEFLMDNDECLMMWLRLKDDLQRREQDDYARRRR